MGVSKVHFDNVVGSKGDTTKTRRRGTSLRLKHGVVEGVVEVVGVDVVHDQRVQLVEEV